MTEASGLKAELERAQRVSKGMSDPHHARELHRYINEIEARMLLGERRLRPDTII